MKIKKSFFVTIIICLFVSGIIAFAEAETTLTVDEIMDKIDETEPNYTTQKTISEMILIDKEGKEEIRDMVMFSQKIEDDQMNTLVRFLSPKSVKGVTLLNINDGEKIYLYMPAYNKPRRIAGSSKVPSVKSRIIFDSEAWIIEDSNNVSSKSSSKTVGSSVEANSSMIVASTVGFCKSRFKTWIASKVFSISEAKIYIVAVSPLPTSIKI